mmetsp:Transcript_37119/g.73495  ORF Transcript_37119/g.73495 Transcript_37119/m.73495 type:complete len:187 (-) Transcript_37119:155-715(-)
MAQFEHITRHRIRPVDREIVNIKLLVVGDSGVGKTALTTAFCNEASGLPTNLEPTIGADFYVRGCMHHGRELRVNIWDLSGDHQFAEVRNEFYKDAQGAVLCFDTTACKSFQNLESWFEEMQRCNAGGGSLKCAVVGTKAESGPRMVPEQAARDWARAKCATYFDVSTAVGKNIESAFRDLASRLP